MATKLFDDSFVGSAEQAVDFIGNILESSTEYSIIGKDLEGKIVLWNEGARRLYGYEPEEVVGRANSSMPHVPEDVRSGRHKQTMQAALRDGKWEGTLVRLRKDGSRFTARVVITPRRDSRGKAIGYLLISKDITAEVRLTEKLEVLQSTVRIDAEVLHQSEAHYRTLFENMQEGFAHCRMLFEDGRPRDFVYLEVNGAFEKLTGLHGVVGKKASELMPGIRESDSELLETYGRVALTGKPERFEKFVVALNHWFTISVYSADLGDFVAVFDVITERKRAEAEFRQLSDRLLLATRAAAIGVWDFDVVNNTLIWDDAMYRLYGVRSEQFIGAYEAWQACLHPEDRARATEEVQMALRGEKDFNTECRVLWPDKSVHFIKAAGLVQRDAAGRPVRMLGTNWDITERKCTEEALRRSEAELVEAQRLAKYGNWSWDVINDRLVWSDELYRIFGIEKGKRGLTYQSFFERVEPADREAVLQTNRDALQEGKSFEIVYGIITPA